MSRGKVPRSLQESMVYALLAYHMHIPPAEVDELDPDMVEKLMVWLEHFLKSGYSGNNNQAGIG